MIVKDKAEDERYVDQKTQAWRSVHYTTTTLAFYHLRVFLT